MNPAAPGLPQKPEGIPGFVSFLSRHPYMSVAALGTAVYARTLAFGFNFLDDNVLVLERAHLLGRPSYLWQAFSEDAFRSAGTRFYYRPLLTVSFWLDAWWGGVRPFPFRLTNFALHLACACLCYRLLVRLKAAPGEAWFCSLAFSVHPAFTLVPSLLSARNDSLLGLWLIPSFLAFLRFQESGLWSWGLLHMGLWVLGLLTKETAVVLPLLCLSHRWLVRDAPPRAGWVGACLCWVLIGLFWFRLRSAMLGGAPGQLGEVLQSLPSNLPAFLGFLGRVFFPLRLSVYPLMDPVKLGAGLLAFGAIAVLLWRTSGADRRRLFFGGIWFALLLLPSLVKPRDLWSRHDIMETRVYLPCLGLGMLLAGADLSRMWRISRAALAGAGFSIVALFTALSFAQNAHYRDRLSFWKNATATSPESAFAGNNMGAMYYLEGSKQEAELEWRRTLNLNPHERLAHGNLGLVLMQRGAWEEAEKELLTELKLNPRYDHAHFNLGLLYYSRGRAAEALRLWEKTLDLNPDYTDAYTRLIVHYYNARDIRRLEFYLARVRLRGLVLPSELTSALEKQGRRH